MGGQWTPRTPDWVTPPISQIADLHWLAYATLIDTRRPWAAGVFSSVAWVRGGRVSPVTERSEQPVTRALAEYERWAAEAARDPAHPPPLETIADTLGVPCVPPKPGLYGAAYAVGVWSTLRWMLQRVPDEKPPLEVPRRHPDGRVFTAADIYAERIAAAVTHPSPEARREIRVDADRLAARYQHQADAITDIQHRLNTRPA